MYDDGIQTYTAMFLGFRRATVRFMRAVEEREPTDAYVTLFEALNWAVVLDDRTGALWAPHGEVLGWRWREEIDGAAMLGGVRFARNSMHHDWSEVLELSTVASDTSAAPFEEWTWRPVTRLPARGKKDPDAEAAYAEQLAGRMVRSTLVGLASGFGLLRSLLEPGLGFDPDKD